MEKKQTKTKHDLPNLHISLPNMFWEQNPLKVAGS